MLGFVLWLLGLFVVFPQRCRHNFNARGTNDIARQVIKQSQIGQPVHEAVVILGNILGEKIN